MQFLWDPEKEKANKKKHGIAFPEACYVFADKYMLTLYDKEHSDAEDRWITVGETPDNRILLVVHTYRKMRGKEAIRIISARKATKHESIQYLERRR